MLVVMFYIFYYVEFYRLLLEVWGTFIHSYLLGNHFYPGQGYGNSRAHPRNMGMCVKGKAGI